jgi:hypothetical protein
MSIISKTVNDVVLGVTQAGLSRYLDRRYGKFIFRIYFSYFMLIFGHL